MHLKIWWYYLWQAALGYSLLTSFSEVSVTIAVLLSTLISVSFQSRKHIQQVPFEFKKQWPWTTKYKNSDHNRCLIPKMNLDCIAVLWIERHSLNHCAVLMKFLAKEQQCSCRQQ